ncbi:adhesion G protein-coupled receptor L2-like [Branchiostoma lanceolatum]|uniref:adhesion G protein-coupled receptor L2-like n=1 Tax=Branchiostoma lanceolatum TaxID=7740 RepID=UPI0034564678
MSTGNKLVAILFLLHAMRDPGVLYGVDGQITTTPGTSGYGHSKKVIFPYPRSTSNYAQLMTSLHEDLSSFTLCVHMRTNDTAGSLVSYATSQSTNDIFIEGWIEKGYKILVADGKSPSGKSTFSLPVLDGRWHAICTTWQNTDGAWGIYVDGVLNISNSGLSTGEKVSTRGTWILGQDQDSLGGGFDRKQAFSGEMSRVNLWDSVLSPTEIGTNWTTFCSHQGNVINWTNTEVHVFGDASFAQYDHCDQWSTHESTPKPLISSSAPPPRITDKSVPDCPVQVRRNLTWPKTVPGMMVTQNCPNGTVGTARRKCGTGGTWEGEPDLSDCTSPWVGELLRLVEQGGPAGDVLSLVKGNLANEDEIYGGDVIKSIDLLGDLVAIQQEQLNNVSQEEKKGIVTNFTKTMTTCVSTILSSKRGNAWGDIPTESQSGIASGVMDSLEKTGVLLATSAPNDTISILEDNVVMDVRSGSKEEATTFPDLTMSESPVWRDVQDKITLPKTDHQVVAALYGPTLGGYLKPKATNTTHAGSNDVEKIVNSRVISATVVNDNSPTELGGVVTILLEHSSDDKTINLSTAFCSFWNFSLGGFWSNEGCTKNLDKSNLTHTTCECTHLTNFAILMAVTELQDARALHVITYVGCIISIVCLVLCICVFLGFRRVRCPRTIIHANLCFCLLAAELVFLVAVEKTQNAIVCDVIAITLHYLFLAVFTWMCVEGVELYVLLVKVFNLKKKRLIYYYLIGYVTPAVVVGVSVAVNYIYSNVHSVDLNGYGTETYCWLSVENYFIWSFVGPALLIILVNLGFMIMTLKVIYSQKSNKKGEKSEQGDKLKFWIRVSVALLCVMGVTWVFGVLSVIEKETLVFAYIFTVINSFQGLFIFLFHCVLNEKVQEEMVRRFGPCTCCMQKRSYDWGSSQSTVTQSRKQNGTYLFIQATQQDSSGPKSTYLFTKDSLETKGTLGDSTMDDRFQETCL